MTDTRKTGLHALKGKASWLTTIATYAFTLLRSHSQRKYTLRWLRSLQNDFLLTEPSPWLAFDAIDFIAERIKPGWKIFEYGSGGSTLFWLSRGASCVSVEHDALWYKTVRKAVPKEAPLDYRPVPPELNSQEAAGGDEQFADPYLYLSADAGFTHYEFSKYVRQIDEFADGTFDMALIDGRARPSCILHSISKVKADGLLVLDNSERDYYLEKTQNLLSGFSRLDFWGALPGSNWMSQTGMSRSLCKWAPGLQNDKRSSKRIASWFKISGQLNIGPVHLRRMSWVTR